MEINQLPPYDPSDNSTGCCPRFNPAGWDGRELHFRDKLFVSAKTKSIAHVPLNMGTVFRNTFEAIERAGARNDGDFIVLSRELSPWSAEHLFAVARDVPGEKMVRLSGDFSTAVFEGPFKQVRVWARTLVERAAGRGKVVDDVYFFYTTCPKCAKAYGKNYVVAVSKEHSATTPK